MQIKLMAVAGALVVGAAAAFAQTNSEDFMPTPQQFSQTITKTVSAQYLLYLPKGYAAAENKDRRWPLLFFLHGAGERGTNLQAVAKHGPAKFLQSHPEFPFILVAPQCPPGEVWADDTLLALLDEVGGRLRVDARRVYLTGLSMGGFGTWSLGIKYPERFAAIAPICGGGETIKVLLASRTKGEALKTLGVWAFHGAKDPVVNPEESQRMITALQKAGVPETELTVYPEAKHDAWTETYSNAKLYEWLLRHERK
jgi:predicted peptidase